MKEVLTNIGIGMVAMAGLVFAGIITYKIVCWLMCLLSLPIFVN